MAKLDQLIKAWDDAHWEFSLVFEGLADEDVWKRPHPRLLSIGEIAGHVAFWDAVRTADPEPEPKEDLSQIPIKSPLLNAGFRYYTTNVEAPLALELGAQEVANELKRIHEEAKASVTKVERDSEDPVGGLYQGTWGESLQYMGFHAAYHCGQAYSVRHFFGHETTDN